MLPADGEALRTSGCRLGSVHVPASSHALLHAVMVARLAIGNMLYDAVGACEYLRAVPDNLWLLPHDVCLFCILNHESD